MSEELANHPGWITNGELTGEYVRPPSKWDNELERIAIYLYRAERGWARDVRWLDAGKSVRKDYLDRAWAVASMCNFPNHSDALERLSPLCPCDPNPETSDGPEQECPLHGDGVTFVGEVRRLESVEQAATALRILLLDYLPTLEDRLPRDALGPLYAALFVAPPRPLTEQEIARGQEIAAILEEDRP